VQGGNDDRLDVDSGMLAVVDAAIVDDFLAVNASLLEGRDDLGDTGCRAAGRGLLCATGGDGQFPFAASARHGAAVAFEVRFDDLDPAAAPWTPIATIPAGSGAIVVGDPDFLREFVDDPFPAPYEVYGAWAILAMPGPGVIGASVIRSRGRIVGLRGEWLPG
jgi:hypothetical protein